MKNKAAEKHQLQKPAQVVNAIRLLYVSLGITALSIVLQTARSIATKTSTVPVILDLIILLGIQLYLITRIARGMDWARLAYLVWFIVSLAYSVFLFFPVIRESSSSLWLQTFLADLPAGVLSLAQTILEFIALVLLFQAPSDRWFRDQKMY